MKNSFAASMAPAAVLAAVALAAACGRATSPSPVSPSPAAASQASPGSASARVHVDGAISSIDQAARSIQVTSTTVVVPAGIALATNTGQMEFKDLRVEMQVHIVGTVQQNGVVSAEEVQVDDKGAHPEPPENENEIETEWTGVISSVRGTCPDLTLVVAGRSVMTANATAFVRAACRDLAVGATVEVEARAQSNGLVASKVQLEDARENEPPQMENEVEFTGLVSAVLNGCPAPTLTIAGRTVMTNQSTEFKGGTCGDIKSGTTTLEVKGMSTANGPVTATRLRFEK